VWLLSPTGVIRSHAPRLPGRRPSSAVSHFGGYEPCSQVLLTRGSPGKDIEDKDNPIHSLLRGGEGLASVQGRDPSSRCLFEGGTSLALQKKSSLLDESRT
jgi:hypothetical protein